MDILKNIVTGIVATTMAVGSFFGIGTDKVEQPVVDSAPTLGAYNVSGGGTYRLQTSIGSTDTSIRLSSFKEPISNIAYTMSYLNTSIAYGTLDPQQPTRSEFISFTGITQNSDGTAVLTGVTRGLARSYPYTASSTFRQSHSGQSIFILSNAPQLYNEYAAKKNDETITGAWNFPLTPSTSTNPVTFGYATSTFVDFTTSNQTITGSKIFASTTFTATTTFQRGALTLYPCTSSAPATQVCDKNYIDNIAIAGAPDASETTKGIVEEATQAETDAGTAVGGTGAKLFITPAKFASSSILTGIVSTASTSVPIPLLPLNSSPTTDVTYSSTTKGVFGTIDIPYKITFNKMTLRVGGFTATSTFLFGLYDYSGNRVLQATSSLITSATTTLITLPSPVTLNSGLYWTGTTIVGGGNIQFTSYNLSSGILGLLNNNSSSTAIYGGTMNIASGTLPTSFNSQNLNTAESSNSIPLFRLDK